MNRLVFVIVLLISVILFKCTQEENSDNRVIDLENVSLKQEADFLVGMAVNSIALFDKGELSIQRRQIILQEFNSLTPEWEIKHKPLTKKGTRIYDWSKIDKIVNFAVENDLRVYGHTLVWEHGVPDWMKDMDSASFENEAKAFIEKVMQRFKGKVTAYDVVNEAWKWSHQRENTYYNKLGPDYIARMFKYARTADPSAKLFYNDFNLYQNDVWPDKFNMVLEMIDDFQNRGIPIDGIGFQSHLRYNEYSLENFEKALQAVVNRGLMVHISEFDFLVNQKLKNTELTELMAEEQAEAIKKLVATYRKVVPDSLQFGFTIWGLKDNESWHLNDESRRPDWPLLFDENFQKKPAYRGFVEGCRTGI